MDEAKEMMAIYAQGEQWVADEYALKRIEELAYLGLLEFEQMSVMLGVTKKQFAYAVAHQDEVVLRVKKGKVKALEDLNSNLMSVATGKRISDPATVAAAKFILGARYNYDERNKLTSAQIRNMNVQLKLAQQKLELEKDKLEYLKQHNAIKLSMHADDETLDKWSKLDVDNS